ncbi:MAG: tetratricopeptide repeat protein [Methanocorpusculum sp.]|nr:tetratricopeptide repeat protein [Methanocorpusculum sp.]
MAQALAGLEQYGDAVAAFERTLILLPDDHAALTGLANCYEALGEFEKMTACRVRLGELD